MYAEEAGHVGAVSGVTGGYDARGKLHGPRTIFFDLAKAGVFIDHRAARFEAGRLFAGEIAAGIQRIDTNVHERAAAGHSLVKTPLARVFDKAIGALYGLNCAEFAVPNQLNRAQV